MFLFPKIHGTCHVSPGYFSLPGSIRISRGDFAPFCTQVFAQRMGLPFEEGASWLTLHRDPDLPPEGYRLTVATEGIHLTASTENGIIHGLTTLYLATEDSQIPFCSIEDTPKHPHRGQSLDVVRHFFPLEEVERILDQMSLVKMNVLHLHLTDDQGWRIEIRKHPDLHAHGDCYTQDDLRHLVEFARLRGIRIIPEIDLPGHTTAILAAYPQLGCTGQTPGPVGVGGIYNTILCAGNEEVYVFLEDILEEVCAIFPDPEFHIGGDEAPKSQWHSCPRCREKLRSLGRTDFEDLQSYFTGRVADILRKHGKSPVCWNETLLGNPIPENLRIQFWTLEGYQQMLRYARQGRPFVFSSMYELYLDYPYSMTGVKKLYRMTPKIWGRPCHRLSGFLGFESTVWAEYIADARTLEEHLFPRLYIVAEKAWSGGHEAYPRFLRSLTHLCDLAHRDNITTQPPEDWNPTGLRRRKASMDFFLKMNAGVVDPDLPANQEAPHPNLPLLITYVTRFFRLWDLPELAKHYLK